MLGGVESLNFINISLDFIAISISFDKCKNIENSRSEKILQNYNELKDTWGVLHVFLFYYQRQRL